MAPKKRHNAPSARSPSASSPTSAVKEASASNPDGSNVIESRIGDTPVDCLDASDRGKCEQVFLAVGCGNASKALKFVNDLRSRNPNCGIVHDVEGRVYFKLGYDVTDPAMKQKYFKKALESARRAVSLSPNSLFFIMFHAKVLFNMAKDDEGFEETARECRRGLNIERPGDPLDDTTLEEKEFEDKTPQGRINSARRCLQELLDHVQATRSNPSKGLTDGGAPENLTGDAKDDKTAKMKKKVDELKDLNRLNQDLSKLIDQKEPMDEHFDSSSRLRKLEEKRKYTRLKMNAAFNDKIDRTRSYWNTMAADEKLDLLENRIVDIEKYLGSLKDKKYLEIFSEAVHLAKVNKSWKYWDCCSCREKFKDWPPCRDHIWRIHLSVIPQTVKNALPLGIERAWVEMLKKSPWKPIDVEKAVKMMRLESQNSSHVDHTETDIDETKDCETKFDLGYVTFIPTGETYHVGKSTSPVIDLDVLEWPLCDDIERAKILERIKNLFLSLLKNDFISFGIVDWIMRLTTSELRSVVPISQISEFFLDKSPLSICFLDASKLNVVLDPLNTIASSCNLSQCSEEEENSAYEVRFPPRERVVFNQDFSSLVLDKSLMNIDLNCLSDDESDVDSSSAVISGTDDIARGILSESDDFITWLFSAPKIEVHVGFWTSFVENRKFQAIVTFGKLRIEIGSLLRQSGLRIHQLFRWNQIGNIKASISEQLKNSGGVLLSYESILSKRQKELREGEAGGLFIHDKVELQHIDQVLRGAQALTLAAIADENDQSKILNQNLRIQESFRKLDDKLSTESSVVEAKIWRTIAIIGQLEQKMLKEFEYDYREIIFPLLRCFSQMRLEDMFLKDATEKADAAGIALLAEVELDAKKSLFRGEENKSRKSKKSKDKKKKKNLREVKAVEETPEIEKEDSEVVSIHVPPVHDEFESNPPDMSEVDKPEQLGTDIDEELDDMSQLNDEFKQLQMSEISEKTYAVTEESNPPDMSEVDKPEQLGTDIDEELDNMSQLNDEFKQQMSEISEKTDAVTEENLEPETASSVPEIIENSSSVVEKNLDDNMITSSELEIPVTTQNDSQIEVKEDAGLQHDKKTKMYEILFGSFLCFIDCDIGNSSQVGLRNDYGEQNCFLNVIIQSLRHLRLFHDEFMKVALSHCHAGEPCVVCSLHDVFTGMRKAAREKSGKAVDPTSLRHALSYFCPERKFFQTGQMNDASEVLGSIFHSIHLSLTSASDSFIYREDQNLKGSGECAGSSCLAHTLFGINIYERLECVNCGVTSRFEKYVSFFHNLNANLLREMKISHVDSSFSQLLKLVEMNDPRVTCDIEEHGCGKRSPLSRYITQPPHFFTIVLGWKSCEESQEDISATMDAISPDMDISLLYKGLEKETKYWLVSLVCYVRLHYICIAYSRETGRWVLYDDTIVRVVGNWGDVISMCKSRLFQPQLLFFEAV